MIITKNSEFTSKIASAAHKVGTTLTNPLSHRVKHVVESHLNREEITPKRAGAAVEGKKEPLASAVLKTLGAVVPAIVGAPLRVISTQFRGDAVFYHPKTAEEALASKRASDATPDETLKLMAYNICAMPEFISYRNELKHPMRRLELFCKEILEADAEVVCLQEAFHTEVSTALVEKLRHKYPYAVCNAGVHSFALSSGNLILSKHPISRIEYERYSHRGGDDGHASKGPLAVTIEKKGRQYNIIGAHLNGGAPEGGSSWRTKQLKQIHDFALRYFAGSPHPTFLVADTNISMGEYIVAEGRFETPDMEIKTLLKYFQVFSSLMPAGTSVDVAKNIHRGQTVDWVCRLKGVQDHHVITREKSDVVDKYEASDHKGLVVTLRIAPGTESIADSPDAFIDALNTEMKKPLADLSGQEFESLKTGSDLAKEMSEFDQSKITEYVKARAMQALKEMRAKL